VSTRIAIAGVGEAPQGRSPLPHTMALHAQLADLALADAGIALDAVDAVLTVAPQPFTDDDARALSDLGL
jgi:hypothetical protein